MIRNTATQTTTKTMIWRTQRHDIEGGFWFARDQNEVKRYSVDVCIYFNWNGNTPGYKFCAPFPETVSAFGSDVTLCGGAGRPQFVRCLVLDLRGAAPWRRVWSAHPGPAPPCFAGDFSLPDADGGPDCRLSEAITNGIRVRASVAYMPHKRVATCTRSAFGVCLTTRPSAAN